jgi:hypothetical protein
MNIISVDQFEKSKTVRGSLVRIYTRDTGNHEKIHGAYKCGDDWHTASWNSNGFFNNLNNDEVQPKSDLDLEFTISTQ